MVRKALVAVAAVAAFTATGVPAAHAETLVFCGSEQVNGAVRLQSCFSEVDPALYTFRPRATFYSTATGTWTSCTVYLALYDNSVKVRQTTHDCLHFAKNNIRTIFGGDSFGTWAGHCYTTQAKWVGTYNGLLVGSSQNSRSSGGPCG